MQPPLDTNSTNPFSIKRRRILCAERSSMRAFAAIVRIDGQQSPSSRAWSARDWIRASSQTCDISRMLIGTSYAALHALPVVFLPRDPRDWMRPYDAVEPPGPAVYPTRAAAPRARGDRVPVGCGVDPALQASIAVLDDKYYLRPGTAEPADNGLARLLLGQYVLACRASQKG